MDTELDLSWCTLADMEVAGLSLLEAFITYPLEYLKVREQISIRPLNLYSQKLTIPNYTTVGLRGVVPYATGQFLRASTRIIGISSAQKFSGGSPVMSGLLSALAEGAVMVPFESVKTALIEASAVGKGAASQGSLPVPGSKGTVAVPRPSNTVRQPVKPPGTRQRVVRPHAPSSNQSLHEVLPISKLVPQIRRMYAQRGIRAFVQGFNPIIAREVTMAGLRYTTLGFYIQFTESRMTKLTLTQTVVGSGLAAFVETALTQPLDTLVSRSQTSNGPKIYGSSLFCAYRVISEEGVARLWAGSLARFLKLWLGGTLMWAALTQLHQPDSERGP